ncbi:MAG: ATP-binding protein [Pirellulaceae bacterium]|nr:ATP-binding protein [Pirellulaceae bacterium]
MTERRSANVLPTALLAVVCATLGLAWVAEPSFAPSNWVTRLGVLFGGATLFVLIIHLAHMQAVRSAVAAHRYVERLCELEPQQLQDDAALPAMPLRKEDLRWREVCDRLRGRLAEFAERAEAAEMARASCEVRLRRLAGERDQLREILASLPDPVVAVDSFGEITLANPSAQRLLDIPATGDTHPALAQLKHCEELVGLLAETRRRKAPTHRSGEVALLDSQGQPHWYRVNCRALATAADASSAGPSGHGALAVLSDISHLKSIQKRNAEFVSSVSHEMKTPLSSIRAYIELLVDGEADDDQTREEFLGVISSQADRLQRLVENLLNLARIEAGVVAVHKSALSLNEKLAEAVRVLEPTAEQKQIRLTSELSPLYLGVLADQDMLLQAAINLVSNAVKYTPAGGNVTVKSRLADQEVILEVQDSGVGLSPDDCQRVFEKFYRVKKDREMAPGTGLGLALVKHIVEDVHGGRVEVESELGRGSTFRVILPGLNQLSA